MSVTIPEIGRVCLRQLRRAAPQNRSFSSTAKRPKGIITTFPPTSSPELDSILSQLRENVFLPAHLGVAQKHLIFRKNHQHYLTGEEPVRVELPTKGAVTKTGEDGELPKAEFILKPLEPTTDIPKFKIAFNDIFNILKGKTEDWVIVPELLRELRAADYKLTSGQVAKIVRRAAESDRLGMMVECFRQVETLDFRLRNFEIAQLMMLGSYRTALEEGFEGISLDRAIRHAEATMRLIQDKRHVDTTAESPFESPELHGAALGLISMRIWRRQTQPPADAQVADTEAAESSAAEGEEPAEAAAETPAAETPQGSPSTDMAVLQQHAENLFKTAHNGVFTYNDQLFRDCENTVHRWLPAWFGLQAAIKALPSGSELATRLQTALEADIGPHVQKAVGDVTRCAERDGRTDVRTVALYNSLKDALT